MKHTDPATANGTAPRLSAPVNLPEAAQARFQRLLAVSLGQEVSPDLRPEEATRILLEQFERPANAARELRIRQMHGQALDTQDGSPRLARIWPQLLKFGLFRLRPRERSPRYGPTLPDGTPLPPGIKPGDPIPYIFQHEGGTATVTYVYEELGPAHRRTLFALWGYAQNYLAQGQELVALGDDPRPGWAELNMNDVARWSGRSGKHIRLEDHLRPTEYTHVTIDTPGILPGARTKQWRFTLMPEAVRIHEKGRPHHPAIYRVRIPDVILDRMQQGDVCGIDLWALDALEDNALAQFMFLLLWDRCLTIKEKEHPPLLLEQLVHLAGIVVPSRTNDRGHGPYLDWSQPRREFTAALELIAGKPLALAGGVIKCMFHWRWAKDRPVGPKTELIYQPTFDRSQLGPAWKPYLKQLDLYDWR